MSSKTKSISELINELEKENENLKGIRKGFESMCRAEFSLTIEEIHRKLEKAAIYERKIAEKQGQVSAQNISGS